MIEWLFFKLVNLQHVKQLGSGVWPMMKVRPIRGKEGISWNLRCCVDSFQHMTVFIEESGSPKSWLCVTTVGAAIGMLNCSTGVGNSGGTASPHACGRARAICKRKSMRINVVK